MFCRVTRLEKAPEIDANWDKFPWKNIRSEPIRNYMGEKPKHIPETRVKIAGDDGAIYVIFRVEDRYVRAVTTGYQGNVCQDSCVEFFFTPNGDLSKGYFNLEMNCGGTALFAFQQAPRKGTISIPESEYNKIKVAHSLPKIVDPEIEIPVTWTVEYRIPIEIMEKYCPVTFPASKVTWQANFYKCADRTSHPHWLAWSRVDFPTPQFHLPESFGVLEFE